jgi:hypothetical protein
VVLPVGKAKKVSVYDPWGDVWTDVARKGKKIVLPDFKRSLVVKIEY